MESRQRAHRLLTVTVAAAAAGTAVALAVLGQRPALGTLAVFVCLVVYGELKAVDVGSVVIGPGWMILTASLVAFNSTGRLLGPMLASLAWIIYLPDFRARRWQVIAFNGGMVALATLSAAAGIAALPAWMREELPAALLAPLVATICFVVVQWSLATAHYALRDSTPVREVVMEFIGTTPQWISFSFLGYLLGMLYLELGAAVMLLIIVPILIAREMFASYMKVKESHDETVKMLIRALETKDQYTAGHSGRVATYAEYMGKEFGFGPGRMERLRFGALMHDIGKLVVPNHILNKPGKLTEEEFARVRLHEQVTVQMLSHIDFLRPIAAQSHGDAMRFDPDDADHPIEPYMVMIADAYDAMTSTRSYRKALPQDVAFQELRDKAGTQFHPECVEALIRAIEKRGEHHGKGYEEDVEFEHAPEAGLGSAGLGDLLSTDS